MPLYRLQPSKLNCYRRNSPEEKCEKSENRKILHYLKFNKGESNAYCMSHTLR